MLSIALKKAFQSRPSLLRLDHHSLFIFHCVTMQELPKRYTVAQFDAPRVPLTVKSVALRLPSSGEVSNKLIRQRGQVTHAN